MRNATPEQIFTVAKQYHKEGNLDQAEALYKAVLSVKPASAEAWFFLGMVRYAKGAQFEAVDLIKKALEIDPKNYDFHNNIGEIYRRNNMMTEAEFHLKASLTLKPDNTDAHSNLGLIYKAAGEIDKAKLCFSNALQCNPKNVNAILNAGSLYQSLNELTDALECYLAAMTLDPDNPHALRGAAYCMTEQGEYNTAAGMLSRLTAGKPDLFREKVDLAFLTLRNKDFRKGLQLLESRLKHLPEILEGPEKTLWRGTPLKAKTLYVYYEKQGLSGFGDTLMFMRFIHDLKKYEPQKVVFRVQTPLLELVKANMPDFAEATDEPCAEYDVHSPLISLMLILNVRAKSMSLAEGYIKADGERFKNLTDSSKTNIAVVFKTSEKHTKHERRSVPQEIFDKPAGDDSLKLFYVSAQEPESPLHANITDMRPHIANFQDTADILAAMDMVITADTAVAHLAGAMGINCALLLDHLHDWRWFTAKTGQNTVWYSSVTTYIRENDMTWDDTLSLVKIKK